MKAIDLVKIPQGYTGDVHELCIPVLEVALLRGETTGTFEDDFFFETLDTHLAQHEQKIILYNARRYLGDGLDALGREFEPFYEKIFEEGCRNFIHDFLYLNQLHAMRSVKSDVWKIDIKPVSKALWCLTTSTRDSLRQ